MEYVFNLLGIEHRSVGLLLSHTTVGNSVGKIKKIIILIFFQITSYFIALSSVSTGNISEGKKHKL
jgi:hypothetical protein